MERNEVWLGMENGGGTDKAGFKAAEMEVGIKIDNEVPGPEFMALNCVARSFRMKKNIGRARK